MSQAGDEVTGRVVVAEQLGRKSLGDVLRDVLAGLYGIRDLTYVHDEGIAGDRVPETF